MCTICLSTLTKRKLYPVVTEPPWGPERKTSSPGCLNLWARPRMREESSQCDIRNARDLKKGDFVGNPPGSAKAYIPGPFHQPSRRALVLASGSIPRSPKSIRSAFNGGTGSGRSYTPIGKSRSEFRFFWVWRFAVAERVPSSLP